ncbi:MAG: copper chaperone PCu(A)C [Bdellovibrio bacteriovorus]
MPQTLRTALLAGLCAVAALSAQAQDPAVAITDAYARAVPPGQPNSAVFLTLTNGTAQPRALVGGSSPVAEVVELHTHIHADGMMRMRRVERIEVPAGDTVRLQPGGLHIMLIGLKGDLAPGDQVDLTLSFDDGTQTQVLAPVRKAEAMNGQH